MDPDYSGPDSISFRNILSGPPERISSIVTRRLQWLQTLVPAKIRSAALRTLFNGWSTARRFQYPSSMQHICWLGCGSCTRDGGDSLEHYSCCPISHSILNESMRYHVSSIGSMTFWLLYSEDQRNPEVLALSSLFIYSIYMTTNFYRHRGTPPDIDEAKEFAKQAIIQGCQGCPKLTSLFVDRGREPMKYISHQDPYKRRRLH